MYSLPISETEAIAVDDHEPDEWGVYVVNYATQSISAFDVEGIGAVEFAHYDHGRELLWVIVEGCIFAIQRSKQAIFEVPMPDMDFFAYSMVGEGEAVFVSGEYSNLWRLELPSMEWTPLLVPNPKPPRSSSEEAQTRQVQAYAEKYPPLYHGFQSGSDYYFCGALGTLIRVRGRKTERIEVDVPTRLVRGVAGYDKIILSSDSSGATVYSGTFEDGFEILLTDTLPALNLFAPNGSKVFWGVAGYPPSDVHNLYEIEGGDVKPVNTGAAREPLALTSLLWKGNALYASDPAGLFRFFDGSWTLLDDVDLKRGTWPEAN